MGVAMDYGKLIDLIGVRAAEPIIVAPAPDVPWEELATLWNSNRMQAAHDWLNERWARLIKDRLLGQNDPEAKFLQGLAYAVLALFFTQTGNQAGALLLLDDAVVALNTYRPRYLGVSVDPILDTLQELRPTIASLAPDAAFPMAMVAYRKFEFRQ
jgi:hypothetical protein